MRPRSGRVQHVPARRCPRRRPGLQSEVGEEPLDHWRLDNGRNDLELAAAVRAVLEVDLESEASAKTNLYSSYVAAKTRLSSRAQLSRAGLRCTQLGSAAASSDTPASSAGSAGTTSARSFALGASTPWFAQRESAHFAKRSYADTNRIRCNRGRGMGA